MISLGKLFSSYSGFLRQFKAVYILNNVLNRRKLQHNKKLYRKYGLRRSIFGALGSHNFKQESTDIPWLDRPDALDALQQHPAYATFSSDMQQQLRQFVEEGYMVLEGFFGAEEVHQLNTEIEHLLEERALTFNYTGRKVMESYKLSEQANAFFRAPRLLEILRFLMGKTIIPFHTINFVEGSEQRAHSDSIHMTTEPRGYLIAAWTALEEIHDGNGPLFFYPRSHRLPYVMCQDYPSGNSYFLIGQKSNKMYEDKIEALLEKSGLERKIFHGKKGDVFIWHANLIHGGLAISQKGATRKSMVSHYFCEDVICYHEMSQRPALLDLG